MDFFQTKTLEPTARIFVFAKPGQAFVQYNEDLVNLHYYTSIFFTRSIEIDWCGKLNFSMSWFGQRNIAELENMEHSCMESMKKEEQNGTRIKKKE